MGTARASPRSLSASPAVRRRPAAFSRVNAAATALKTASPPRSAVPPPGVHMRGC